MSNPIVAELFVPVEALARQAVSIHIDRLRAEGCDLSDIASGSCWKDGNKTWFEHEPLSKMLDLIGEPGNDCGILLSLTRDFEDDDSDEFWAYLQMARDREGMAYGVGSIDLTMSAVSAGRRRNWYDVFRMLVGVLAASADAIYGWASHETKVEVTPVSASSVAALEPQPLEWLNIYGPAYVERIGLERLLSVPPPASIDVLVNGGVLLMLAPTPDHWRWNDQQAVAEHLGLPVPG